MSTVAASTPTKPRKAAQINIRLTAEQQMLFKQYCNRNGMTTQQAVMRALSKDIEGFAT